MESDIIGLDEIEYDSFGSELILLDSIESDILV